MTEGGGNLGQAAEIAGRLLANVETVVHGKTDEVRLVLAALVCDGHVLLEDVPGTAKTVLARAIAGSVEGASFARIQCTPDLQPTDVTGLSVFNQRDRDFEFRPGPVFANVLLVDEINRAMPKTQSALLEAMAEYQATIDGVTRELPKPFLVLATENPIEQEGTFPLPEAQLDRFLLRTALGYPGEEEELRIVEEQVERHPLSQLRPVLSLDEINVLREAAHGVYIDPLLRRWAIRLVRATREAEGVAIGASVRGALALERSARAWALLSGREFVTTGGHRAALPPRRHAPHRLHAELRRHGPRDRLAGGGGRVPAPVPRDRAAAGGGARAGGVCMRVALVGALVAGSRCGDGGRRESGGDAVAAPVHEREQGARPRLVRPGLGRRRRARRGAGARLRDEGLLQDRGDEAGPGRRLRDREPEPRSAVRLDPLVGRTDLPRSLGRPAERARRLGCGSLSPRGRRRWLAGGPGECTSTTTGFH